jgi:plasmid maintenance system antidote protein VapI
MAEQHVPAQVFSLAEYLADEMAERGWTTSDVANHMGPGRNYVVDKIALDVLMAVSPTRDTLKIDEDTCDSIARAFGVSPQFIRNIHAEWQKWPDRRVAFECPEELFGTDVQIHAPD